MQRNEIGTKKNLSILLLTMGSGGAERVVSNLLPLLHDRYNVTLVLFYDVFHFEVPDYIDTEIIIPKKQLSTIDKITAFFKALRVYSQILKDKEIDISLSLLTRPNLVNTFGASKGIRKVISERCFPSIAYRSNYIRYLLYRFLLPIGYNRADHLFSNSHYINKDLRENFGLKTENSVIYNPVKLEQSKVYTFQQKTVKCITVGSMTTIKNQKLILEAMVGISDASLTLVGDGILRKSLVSLAQATGIDSNITWTGKVKDVAAELQSCDLFILSSNSEGFPNALLEAMANGLAVISTNCKSGPLELLNDAEEVNIDKGSYLKAKYGVLVNVDDTIGLRKAIEYFISNHNEIQSYGNKAYTRASDFTIPHITKQLIKVLESK